MTVFDVVVVDSSVLGSDVDERLGWVAPLASFERRARLSATGPTGAYPPVALTATGIRVVVGTGGRGAFGGGGGGSEVDEAADDDDETLLVRFNVGETDSWRSTEGEDDDSDEVGTRGLRDGELELNGTALFLMPNFACNWRGKEATL